MKIPFKLTIIPKKITTNNPLFPVPPLSVNLQGLAGPISAGVAVTVTCQVIGGRPTPTVSWWLEGRPLHPLGERELDLGNVTESTVVLQVSKEDEGKYLSCRAETPNVLQSVMEKGVKLQVHCKC